MNTDLLTETEAGEYLKSKPATLQWWRHKGRGPKYVKMGRHVYYQMNHLEEYKASQVVTPEARGGRA